MDSILTPEMISAALSKLLNGVAGQAGSKAWDALKALITRHRGHAPELPASPEEVSALATELADAAREDPALARDLGAWHQSVVGSDNVTNIVTGSVGRLVQGRDFNDTSITFN